MTQEVKEAGTEQGQGNAYPTIQDIRKIFKNHGFDVTQSDDGRETYRQCHLVQFNGDYPDEGFRAFDVALQHGLLLIHDAPLRRIWDCWMDWDTGQRSLDRDRPKWEILFQVEDDKGIRGNIYCTCYF